VFASEQQVTSLRRLIFFFSICRYSVIVQPGDSPKENSASKGETSAEAESMASGESCPDGERKPTQHENAIALL